MTGSIKRGLEWLGGSVLIYATLAACSGAPGVDLTDQQNDAGEATAGGNGGQPAVVGGTDTGMAGTVPVAHAAGMAGSAGSSACVCEPVVKEPTVVEAACDKTAEGSPALWAVAEFPGKTALELSAARVLVEYPEGVNKWPAGFATQVATVVVQDGSVTVGCGIAQQPQNAATRVRFVLP